MLADFVNICKIVCRLPDSQLNNAREFGRFADFANRLEMLIRKSSEKEREVLNLIELINPEIIWMPEIIHIHS